VPPTIGLVQQASNLGQFASPVTLGLWVDHLGWQAAPVIGASGRSGDRRSRLTSQSLQGSGSQCALRVNLHQSQAWAVGWRVERQLLGRIGVKKLRAMGFSGANLFTHQPKSAELQCARALHASAVLSAA
jgi:hypothetical protein